MPCGKSLFSGASDPYLQPLEPKSPDNYSQVDHLDSGTRQRVIESIGINLFDEIMGVWRNGILDNERLWSIIDTCVGDLFRTFTIPVLCDICMEILEARRFPQTANDFSLVHFKQYIGLSLLSLIIDYIANQPSLWEETLSSCSDFIIVPDYISHLESGTIDASSPTIHNYIKAVECLLKLLGYLKSIKTGDTQALALISKIQRILNERINQHPRVKDSLKQLSYQCLIDLGSEIEKCIKSGCYGLPGDEV